jgi:hypothetical protein
MNTNEQKHTPTPWESEVLSDGYTIAISKNGIDWCIATLHCAPMSEETKANADLIVRAVNNFEPMQARIQELEEALKKVCNESRRFAVYADLPREDFSGSETYKAEQLLQSSKQL